ncbi:hypothetical protein [Halorussus sp. MSC15.2]|uniref:hypothetical protein n=1 Tax=Halorussus sp. MSC15.2 TaxID=2283638 RepID=UPI0013D47116|nr:hypothetical protein [Halorussus sp. MSC15.2]NEU59188.1 hypothetical protein [Halorussus sp. MSC15.2]
MIVVRRRSRGGVERQMNAVAGRRVTVISKRLAVSGRFERLSRTARDRRTRRRCGALDEPRTTLNYVGSTTNVDAVCV